MDTEIDWMLAGCLPFLGGTRQRCSASPSRIDSDTGGDGATHIAGLSTRYSPYLIVAAAGSAFVGWTVLEILLGSVIQKALPETILDLVTGGLFLLFAVLLYRSAPVATGRVTPRRIG